MRAHVLHDHAWAGLEEAVGAEAAGGGDAEAERLRGLLADLAHGVPAPGGRLGSK